MTWTAPDVIRDDEPSDGDERALLEGLLDYQRQTLLLKCAGLTGEQLCRRSIAASSLSLIGLVRHLAEVERSWFRVRFGGHALPELFCTPENRNAEFDEVDAAAAANDLDIYRAEVAWVTETIRHRSLEDTFYEPRRDARPTLRWVYLQMITEYARHNGHADLLREQIDGSVGE